MENNTTVGKLSGAVNQLMDAYEKLKATNDNLQNENIQLKNTIQTLEDEKNNLSTNQVEDSTQMNSMLSKIESMLTLDNTNMKPVTLDFNEEQPAQNIEQIEENKSQETTSLDLGRMESLLKGM